MDFKTSEGVTEIFRSLGCIGNENCFFVTLKNYNENTSPTAFLGGAVGVFIDSAMKSAQAEQQNDLSRYEGLLINQTERGIGVIPLASKHGMQWTANAAKLTPQLDKAVFIPNENIESIEVKKSAPLNNRIQKVNIELTGGLPSIHQLARVKEKEIPYQEANFAVFMGKYKKGK